MKIQILVLALILTSCSASWHIKKAVKKDPHIVSDIVDTITVTKFIDDTIYHSDGTHTIVQKEVHYDTIVKYQKYDFSELKGWFARWQEEKTKRTDIRQSSKTERNEDDNERKEHRQEQKTERSPFRTWMMFLICAVVLVVAILLIKTNKYEKRF